MGESTDKDRQRVWMEDGIVRYVDPVGQIDWRITLAEVKVIGEYTNADGPYADDYFLILVVRRDLPLYYLSMCAEGMDEFIKDLEASLGSSLTLELVSSTSLDSNIVWPPAMTGRKLFEIAPVRRTSLWGRLRQRMFPQYLLSLTSDVKAALRL